MLKSSTVQLGLQQDADSRSLTRSSPSTIDDNLQRLILNPKASGVPMRVHTNAPTTIPDLQSAANVFLSPDQKSDSRVSSDALTAAEPSVPYPFMAGFVDRKTGGRFNKRVVFDRSDYDDLLGQIID